MSPRLASTTVPAAFVVMWATGFVVARSVAPFAEPMSFLTARFAAASVLLGIYAGITGAAWPAGAEGWRNALVAGILLHGLSLGGVFWSIAHGLPAGVSALIAATQPLLTALVARPLLGEAVPPLRWLGILLGFAGVALVLAPRMGGLDAYPPATVAVGFASVAAFTLGTIWQKRTGSTGDLRAGMSIQFGAAAAITLAAALLTETGQVDLTPQLVLAFVWTVLVLSIGATLLLLVMLRRSAVVGVAVLLFLVPPLSALMGYAMFGETLQPLQLAGLALATLGVGLAGRA